MSSHRTLREVLRDVINPLTDSMDLSGMPEEVESQSVSAASDESVYESTRDPLTGHARLTPN